MSVAETAWAGLFLYLIYLLCFLYFLNATMPASWFAILAAIVSGAVQFVLFLRWLHRRMRNDEIMRAFVICRTFTTRCRKSPPSRELSSTKRPSCALWT